MYDFFSCKGPFFQASLSGRKLSSLNKDKKKAPKAASIKTRKKQQPCPLCPSWYFINSFISLFFAYFCASVKDQRLILTPKVCTTICWPITTSKQNQLSYNLFTYNTVFRLIRPVGNSSDRLTVKLGLKLSQIIGVDMKRQIMITNVWVEQVGFVRFFLVIFILLLRAAFAGMGRLQIKVEP